MKNGFNKLFIGFFFSVSLCSYADLITFDSEDFDILRVGPTKLAIILDQVCVDLATASIIPEKILGTYTAFTADFDISGIYTTIEPLDEEVLSTITIACQKFAETWTILAELDENIIDTQTTLCEKLVGTFTVIAAIQEANFTAPFQETFTILGCFTQIPIAEAQMITFPGSYCLTADIMGTITIAASQVFLDLNEKRISDDSLLIACSEQMDITISNGILENASMSAIQCITGTNLVIENIDFISNATGILCESWNGVTIKNCSFRNHSNEAIALQSINLCLVEGCPIILNTAQILFGIRDSACVKIKDVSVCNNIFTRQNDTNPAYTPLFIDTCEDIICEQCFVNNNRLDNPQGSGNADFIVWFVQDSNNLILKNCSANSNSIASLSGMDNDFVGFRFADCEDASLFQCHVNSTNFNSSAADFNGYFCNTSKNISFLECSVLGNNVEDEFFRGFHVEETTNANIESCQVSNNQTGQFDMFSLIDLDRGSVLKSCVASNNEGSQNLESNNYLISGNGTVITSCIAQGTSHAGPLSSFQIGGLANCVLNCIAKENTTLTETNTGFSIIGDQIFVESCIAKDNASVSGLSVGFANTGTNNVILMNESQGHGAAGVTNYVGVLANTIATLNPATGFTSTVTTFQNISVVSP